MSGKKDDTKVRARRADRPRRPPRASCSSPPSSSHPALSSAQAVPSDAKAGGAATIEKTLSPQVMKRVEELSELQKEYGTKHASFVEEYKALHKKYHEQYVELWTKRAQIVNGQADATPAAGE